MKSLTAFIVTSLVSASAFAGGGYNESEPLSNGALALIGLGAILFLIGLLALIIYGSKIDPPDNSPFPLPSGDDSEQ